MNYYVLKNKSEFQVIESETHLVIDSFDQHHEAKHFQEILNEGKGFQGFTPTFMTQKIRTESTFSVQE